MHALTRIYTHSLTRSFSNTISAMAYSITNNHAIFSISLALTLSFIINPISEASFFSDQKPLAALVEPQTPILTYHKGPLLKGNVTVNLLWYGKFSPSQRAILVDFLASLSRAPPNTVSAWWRTTGEYSRGPSNIVVGNQIVDDKCSMGKRLRNRGLVALASRAVNGGNGVVGVVLTADDVAVDGFCMSRCGTHGSTRGKRGRRRVVHAWVGNSVKQCPGECAWPFHQPIYGPQTPPLVPPNNDVGVDGMVINLAAVLAGTVTNPFGNGYFQGPPQAPLESVTACAGVFGKGAYPGYPGQLLVEGRTGASYNAVGVNGRRFLLPAMWDPSTSTCKTAV